MAKRKAKKKRSSQSETPSRQIEKIDLELLKLMNRRAQLVTRLTKSSGPPSGPIIDSVREIAAQSDGPLSEENVLAIFRELASASQGLVKPQRVAYLGPLYSYSYLAAVEQFGEGADLVPVQTIPAVFEELKRGHVEFGLVPLENSTDGRIVDTLGMFARLPVRICAEVPLRIHHQLLAKCRRDEVTEVHSKPQAISQCREWLAKHLPNARIVETASTTAAAGLAAEHRGAAAIASHRAGMHYELSVIAENIEDNPHNVTRFAVIGDHIAKRTGRDKTSVMLELAHKPGALSDAMSVFKANKLNLTWIESFPMPGTKQEYLFFVEMEGHQDDAKVRKAVEALVRKTVRLETLGSYPAVTDD